MGYLPFPMIAFWFSRKVKYQVGLSLQSNYLSLTEFKIQVLVHIRIFIFIVYKRFNDAPSIISAPVALTAAFTKFN